MQTAKRLRINAWVIGFDETRNYNIKPEHAPHIQAIYGYYLFDRNEVTHCCELTPSYYLIHLYDVVILTPEAQDSLDEEMKDQIFQEYCGGDNIYVHCRSVDAILRKRGKPKRTYHYGETGVKFTDTDYDEQMESLREHLCGNPPL